MVEMIKKYTDAWMTKKKEIKKEKLNRQKEKEKNNIGS